MCSEAALLRQGSVSLCKELATKFQVLSPQLRIIPGFGILPKELAAPPDVLSAELRVRGSAVCVVSCVNCQNLLPDSSHSTHTAVSSAREDGGILRGDRR